VYIPGSIKSVSYSPASKIIKAEFSYFNRFKKTVMGWIELGVDSNLPIYTRSPVIPFFYTSVLDLNWTNFICFTAEEQKQINGAYRAFLKKMRQENTSFQEAMQEQNSHSSDINGLYIDTVLTTGGGGSYTTTDNVPAYNSNGSIGTGTIKREVSGAYFTVKNPMLVNPTNRIIYLKGMNAKRDHEGKVTYQDITMTLQPNSRTKLDYIGHYLFYSNYDDIKDERQFLNDNFYLGYGIRDSKGKLMVNSQ
jgi:hypothetical protein